MHTTHTPRTHTTHHVHILHTTQEMLSKLRYTHTCKCTRFRRHTDQPSYTYMCLDRSVQTATRCLPPRAPNIYTNIFTCTGTHTHTNVIAPNLSPHIQTPTQDTHTCTFLQICAGFKNAPRDTPTTQHSPTYRHRHVQHTSQPVRLTSLGISRAKCCLPPWGSEGTVPAPSEGQGRGQWLSPPTLLAPIGV